MLGVLASVDFDEEFVLVLRSGRAFQILVEDDELRGAVTKIAMG
ncbi:MAG: hypothetical protein ACRDZP_03190 [Acidimicrobiales bacterium]